MNLHLIKKNKDIVFSIRNNMVFNDPEAEIPVRYYLDSVLIHQRTK